MMDRPEGLDLQRSLREVLGGTDRALLESTAARQERTIDAILSRLYNADEDNRREMVLLADEVGLGKTFVALGVAWSVLQRRKEAGLASGPVLVITPQSHALFKKWRREAERFLQLVVPQGQRFEVVPVSNPHELAQALRSRRQTLVIARMPALSGRLHLLADALMAVFHALFQTEEFSLTPRQRMAMVKEKLNKVTHEDLNLRHSAKIWRRTRKLPEVGFGQAEVLGAWRRMGMNDPGLCKRVHESFQRIRSGKKVRSTFWADIRELARAALGETVPHSLPLVIVDEIHNWKNHPQSWWRFAHMLGSKMERLLGLSATPFQLGPHELNQVLALRQALSLQPFRKAFLDARATDLARDLQSAAAAGEGLRMAWSAVGASDLPALELAWSACRSQDGDADSRLPPRLGRALECARGVLVAHTRLEGSLGPFLLRHTRDTSHRAWWVGRESVPDATTPSATGSGLRWRPGLDVTGDAELVHYLMMRAVQEHKAGKGATSLGADLGGSYRFFMDNRLAPLLPGQTAEEQHYLGLVKRAVGEEGHEHPKIAVTADRAFRDWLRGEKTLVFCFNVVTTEAIQDATRARIEAWEARTLLKAFGGEEGELKRRLINFQSRLYNYRQSLFLLFQDHPLAGSKGCLPAEHALQASDMDKIARRLALSGAPREGSRFDRRRVVAVAEQVLVERWSRTQAGQRWIDRIDKAWRLDGGLRETVLAPGWVDTRRRLVEGLSREHEPEPLSAEEDVRFGSALSKADIRAWMEVLRGKAGRDTLAPYTRDVERISPSLLAAYHAPTLAMLPARLRALAARMLRRMLRSPGFLARFILNDSAARPDIEADDDSSDESWSALIHRRYSAASASGESAQERFEVYLTGLLKAVDLTEQMEAFEDASRNQNVVARVTGSFGSTERDRLFTGFNTPLTPEVLIVTSVGQEGIDLHRECRHVIHHDLPWNPATLEQRTGRVDRIGSKSERLKLGHGRESNEAGWLNVAVPYIAGTYDEHRFRVVHGRAHLFEVTMGGKYSVDGHRGLRGEKDDAMEQEGFEDDEGTKGEAWCPLPEAISQDLRLRLEAPVEVDVRKPW